MDKTKNKEIKEESKESGPVIFDYKNVAQLEKYTNQHSRIYSRKRSSLGGREQRKLAEAIKRSRFMAFMPFVAR